MNYQLTLEKAGAEVLLFQEFGSYQGDWWAKVIFNDQTGWVNGAFGSCSHCDSFQQAFDGTGPEEWNGKYYPTDRTYDEDAAISKEEYEIKVNEYNQKLADFGRSYLFNIMDQKEAETKASENLEWDMEATEMIDFIKNNSI